MTDLIDHGAETYDLTEARAALALTARIYRTDQTAIIDLGHRPVFGEPMLLDARPAGRRWQESLADELIGLDGRPYPPVPKPTPPPPPPPAPGNSWNGPVQQLPVRDYGGLELDYVRAPQHRAPHAPRPEWMQPKTWRAWTRWFVMVGVLLAAAGLLPFTAWAVWFR